MTANPPWFQDLAPASFRGVPFEVLSHERSGGRRGPDFEYPDSDVGAVEDTGARLQTYKIDAFITGDEYHIAAAELIDALNTPGPGELEHPRWGTRRVICRDWNVAEENAEGGIARFSLDFREAPEGGLTISVISDPEPLADDAVTAASDAFAETFDTSGSGAVADAAVEATDATLDRVRKALRRSLAAADQALAVLDAADATATLVSDPEALAQVFADTWNVAPFEALRAFTADRPPVLPMTGIAETEVQRVANSNALDAIAQRTALAEYSRQAVPLVEDTFAVYDDAIEIRDELNERIAFEEETTDSAEYEAFVVLRTTVYRRISDAAVPLVQLRTITLARTTSALVLAYDLYGDATRAVEIVDRNRIRHGGFIPAGTQLQVLAE